jgi:hypothetical protein
MAFEKLTEDQYYNYFDEGEANINLDEFQDLNDFISRRRQPKDLGFFPKKVAQNPAMVDYGIGTLPQFDMANLPMYETDDEQVDYLPGQEPSGIAKLLQYIPFVGEKSLGRAIIDMLPKMSPEAKNMRNFYGSRYGLTDTGQVASGIMKGYNPVYGGFLNTITGGRFGQPTQYGLAGAMQRRIENILGRKAAQTDTSRARVADLRNLQREEMRDRADRGESLSSIGKSTFSGPGMAFEKQNSGTGKGPR